MRLDLSADPWGAAMLGAAGLAVLGLVVVLLALAMGTSKRGGAWILAVGCTAFLCTSVLGTRARIHEADAAAKKAAPPSEPVKIIAPDVPPDVDGVPPGADEPAGESAAPAPGLTPTAVDDAQATGGAEIEPATATSDEPTTPGPAPPLPAAPASEPAAPAPSAGVVALAPAPALPTDDAARREAVRERLRAAKAIALDEDSCRDATTIAQTWVGIAAIPRDVMPDRVAVIVRRLERCRRKIVGARAWSLRRDRTAARRTFADTLRDRLASEHPGVWTKTSGDDAVTMRVGAKTLAEAVVQSLLDAGLKAELATLGFQTALFSDGKTNTSVKLEAADDDALLAAELEPLGLHEAFEEP